ncbi:MAG: peptidyl-prolyl cis-trans isomerase [Solirubrobacteraceae bacterium]
MISSPVRTKLAAALCALAVPAAVAGCGGGLSGNAVATVGGSSAITRSAFDHWLSVTAKSGGQQASAVPKPPDFKACIATQRKTLPKPTKGQPTVTDAQLKTQCSKQYTMLRDSVLQFLISEKWLEGEAKDLGLKVTDAEVRKQFETMKKASFKTEAEYQKFLKQSGQSEQDILLRFRSDVLVTKIRDKITKGKDQVPDAAVARYYNANKARFAQPARRDLLVVKTKTKAKAEQAKKRIAKGEDFAKVAKAVSIDAQSKGMGGKLLATQGQLEKPFDSAIFKAKKGALNGPVKTQAGFYVFTVTKITPASQQSQ